jgi:hypothetical protein
MLPGAAAAAAAGAAAASQLPNGNMSRGESHSSLASAGLSAAVAAAGVMANGRGFQGAPFAGALPLHATAAGMPGLGLGSSMPGSAPGSGPPSTTSGALSFIQAHAEGSQRAAANMKLLQVRCCYNSVVCPIICIVEAQTGPNSWWATLLDGLVVLFVHLGRSPSH